MHPSVPRPAACTAITALTLLAAACASPVTDRAPALDENPPASETGERPMGDGADSPAFPDVVDAEVERTGEAYRVSATISSPYDGPERYADAFRVLSPDGTVLGVRELLHDHAGEQPFTRSLDGVEIPEGVEEVIVEGRDLANGWGGETHRAAVPS